MRPLRSFLALAPAERLLLLKAAALLAAIQLGLGRMPFTLLRRLVTGGRRIDGRPADGAGAFADQVVWAVTAASRRVPGRSTCLSRALTVQALLARRGWPSRLQVGVVRGQRSQLEGHAWVECHGRVLIGGTAAEIRNFTRLAAFDVEPLLELPTVGTPQGR
jgi:hypothetical protein